MRVHAISLSLHALSIGALGLVAASSACQPSPVEQVEVAQTELTSAQEKARRAATDEATAEAARQQAEAQRNLAAAEAQVQKSQADFEKARKQNLVTVDERIAIADDKAKELQARSNTLSAEKRVQFDSYWRAYEVQRRDIEELRKGLPLTSMADWPEARGALDSRLDSLERTVDRLGNAF